MSRDQSKSNFWIQSTLSVSDRVGRELTGEWASGLSACWRLERDVALRYRSVHGAVEWRVSSYCCSSTGHTLQLNQLEVVQNLLTIPTIARLFCERNLNECKNRHVSAGHVIIFRVESARIQMRLVC
jgi:hypothetical protein